MRERHFQMVEAPGGVRLRVVVEGAGPLCLLVHGWPESWYSWRHQLDALLAAGYRVAVPDVRGYGGSDKPQAIEAYELGALVEDMMAVLDDVGVQDAVLIGHDWGAPIVWNTALRHPERVRAVVGMSVPYLGRGDQPMIDVLRSLYKDRFFYQLYFQTPGVAEAELDADIRRSLQLIYYGGSAAGRDEQGFLAGCQGPEGRLFDGAPQTAPAVPFMSEEDLSYYTSQFQPHGFGPSLNRYRNSVRDWQWAADLAGRKITQPALFIAGVHDAVLDFVPGVRLHDLMDAHYTDLRGKILIEGAGHWVQQEQPEQVNRHVLEFLEGLAK